MFVAQAATTPDAPAVLFESSVLTYRELNEQANRLAHHLMHLGVTRGSLVGVCMDRSPDLIVALLGILKAGGAYVPLDPAYPDNRLAHVLADTAAPVVLAQPSTAARLTAIAGKARVLCLERDKLALEPTANPGCGVTGQDVVYVMYTSGSTGVPKGVLVRHRGVIRLVRGADYCDFDPGQVFLLHSPLTFDASTFEIWGPLLNGGRLAVLPPGLPAPGVLAEAIRRYGVTTLWLTAGLFHLVVEQMPEALARVRQVIAGGDVLSPQHVRTALRDRGNGILVNGYGPTETTTFACCFRMTADYQPTATIPIGRPIPDTSVHILDEQMQPVPAGDSGELYIGGGGVAAGYLNRPELTRERFVPDPAGGAGDRLYRTGDRVRMGPDGNLEFLGRLDGQVKVAGHRIEPEEIEAELLRHPAVRRAAVVARGVPSGDKQLVAYVVLAEHGTFSAAGLKCDLGERLPRHMVPSLIVQLDDLPLTTNGKVDRAALPHPPEVSSAAASAPIPGAGPGGEVAAIWQRVLGRAVGPEDNFFDLGGTSLQLLQVHAELSRTYSRDIPLMMLFEHPTVGSLSRHLAGAGGLDPALASAAERARLQRAALSRRRTVT
jgi:aspartate racemase